MGIVRPVCTLALAAACLVAPLTAARDAELKVQGRIRHALPADLDGDGRRDLLLLHIEGRGRDAIRRGSLFLQDDSGGFTEPAAATWELAADEAFLDLAEIDGRQRLVSLRRDGVHHYEFDGQPPRARSQRLVATDLSTLGAEMDDIQVADFARRWVAGDLSFLAPTLPEPTLLTRCASGAYGATLLPVPADVYYSTGEFDATWQRLGAFFSMALPEATGDPAGTGRLLFYRRERLLTIDPPARGDCPERSAAPQIHPVEIHPPGEPAWEPTATLARLADLDGDGRTDLVVAIFQDSGLLELDGRVLVFRGREDGSFPRRPDQSLQVEDGQYYLTYLENLDGEGSLEMLVPAARIGVFGFIRLLTRHTVSFRFHLFETGADGRLGAARALQPTLTALVSDRFDIAAATFGDFTGDGLLDLMMAQTRDRICVRRGVRGAGGWELVPRADFCFEGDAFARQTLADLDEDGRPELLQIGAHDERRRVLRIIYLPQE